MISVVVVDDEQLIRSGFAALLSAEPDIQVVGMASSGTEALTVVRRERPDVVLMDIRMPGLDGVSATDAITKDPALSHTRVIVLTTFDLDEYVHRALRSGARGFLLKDAHPSELVSAVRTVAAGESVLAPVLLQRLISAYVAGSSTTPPPWLSTLTVRETEVFAEVCRGSTNAEIGFALHISAATAKFHVGRLLTKVGARDRTELVIAFYEAGLGDRHPHPHAK